MVSFSVSRRACEAHLGDDMKLRGAHQGVWRRTWALVAGRARRTWATI
jgi:hypothetical protein